MLRENSVVTNDESRLFLLSLMVLGCVIIFRQLIKGHTFEIPLFRTCNLQFLSSDKNLLLSYNHCNR